MNDGCVGLEGSIFSTESCPDFGVLRKFYRTFLRIDKFVKVRFLNDLIKARSDEKSF